MKKLLVGASILIVAFYAVVFLVYRTPLPAPVTAAPVTRTVQVSDIDIYKLWQGINNERTTQGIPALSLDPRLNTSASEKCADMVTRDYWSHNSPQGVEPWVFITKHVPNGKKLAENLEFGNTTSEAIVKGWMNSPGHRSNIMNGAYSSVGYGVCKSDDFTHQGSTLVVVQHFVGY